MENVPPEQERFKKNCEYLLSVVEEGLSELRDRGYKVLDNGTLLLAKEVVSLTDPHLLIQGFLKETHATCWEMIRIKNEKFFVDNKDSIFGDLPVDNVNILRDLFITKDERGRNIVQDGFKEQIWTLLHSLVKIAIKYIHKHRDPTCRKQVDGRIVEEYNYSFFDMVDIQKHARNWGVNLEWSSPR
jgi:hypothetical protein